uniref:AlNc14C403G11397 protein n=1 Tax=Albugo laibachii Nc14 TaxID=890382 RepID=F0WYY6_9STRA|nr:AlNc14C403G11397 [Albugo laibachii Nc14]|eukprot:CCA26700.1 AlNc14C403G11397 [Albugo laibachii Nc14]
MTGSFHSESLPALKALLSIINVFIGMRYLTHFSQQDDKAVILPHYNFIDEYWSVIPCITFDIYCNFEKICPALHRLRLRNLPTSTLSNGIDGEKQLSENAIDSLPAPEMELAQLLRHSGSKKPQNTYCTLLKMLQRYTLRARIDESVIPTQLSQFALERFRIILRTKLYV